MLYNLIVLYACCKKTKTKKQKTDVLYCRVVLMCYIFLLYYSACVIFVLYFCVVFLRV